MTHPEEHLISGQLNEKTGFKKFSFQKTRSFVTAKPVAIAAGVAVVAGGFLFLQLGIFGGSSQPTGIEETELAAADSRESESTASRGGERSSTADPAVAAIKAAAEKSELLSEADQALAEQRAAEEAARVEADRIAAEEKAAADAKVAADAKAKAEADAKAVEQRAVVPAPSRSREAAPSAPQVTLSDSDALDRLAKCESGGNAKTNTGNGFYGAFQFSASTWRGVGGSGLPHEHSYETQKQFAQKLKDRSGWGQWPACTKKLGLR